jgi:hypothetical protein
MERYHVDRLGLASVCAGCRAVLIVADRSTACTAASRPFYSDSEDVGRASRSGDMDNGIEVRFEYEGMTLVCDDEAFVRVRDIIVTEATVADAIARRPDESSVRFISVRQASAESTSQGPRWIELVPTILASCFSGVVFIVGLVTIVQWVMRQLS